MKSTSRLTKLKRVPRTPASCSSRSSASVTLRSTVATPRARPFDAPQRIDQRAVVGAVTGRLDDDVLVEAEMVAQREQLVLRGVARRVLALRRVGKLVAGPEDVAMRIDGARRRRLNDGHRRIGMIEASQPGGDLESS